MNENVYSMDGITNASNSCWSGDCIIVPDRSLGSTLPKSTIMIFSHTKPFSAISNYPRKYPAESHSWEERNCFQERGQLGSGTQTKPKGKGTKPFLGKSSPNPLTWHLYISHSAKPLLLTPVNKKTGEIALPREGKSACCKSEQSSDSNLTNGERIALLALRQNTLTR